MSTEALRSALAGDRVRHRDELRRLVEIPSISAQDTGIREAAELVAQLLGERGFSASVRPTGGNPVVIAHGGTPGGRRLLCYEHYDVQPPEPLDEWTYPPFELTEHADKLFGRGVCDTKGHIVCRLAAVDAARTVFGADPVAYTFIVEGEEEIGSPNLEAFIAANADELRADACLWESGGVDLEGRPSVTLGMKGILTVELSCAGPTHDLHSSLGVAIDNPAWRIAAAVGSLRAADGRVLIDGFYDDVRDPTDGELAVLRALPDRSSDLMRAYGVDRLLGDASGLELARRLQAEPCVNVNGIGAGYGGPGTKTVLPARAAAKLDFRLVPDQHPDRVSQQLRSHLDRTGFPDVRVEVFAGEAPARTPLDDPFVDIVRDAAREAYGMEPLLNLSSPGTGPAHPFREILGVPFASSGCGYPGSRAHAPDEHIRIDDFENGKLHSALVIAGLAAGG